MSNQNVFTGEGSLDMNMFQSVGKVNNENLFIYNLYMLVLPKSC